MTQSKNPFFDQFAGAMTNAAGFAEGLWQEGESFFRLQAEKMLGNMDLVKREEFEAVQEMAAKAREENEALKARIESLEALVKARNS
ncbi:MAG: accessory factor UbiK family protein [Pseudomonadota bacterium]